jgi:hypothetical protein
MASKIKDLKDFFYLPNYSIALACCKTETGRHTGILYKDSDGIVRLLHFAFHFRLYNQVVYLEHPHFSTYKWVEFSRLNSINDPQSERKESIINYIKFVVRKQSKIENKIGYAVGYHGDSFDATGELRLTGNAIGLTCSTFIMAIFQSIGITLIDFKLWPHRQNDIEWKEEVVNLLAQHGVDEDHVNAVRNETAFTRFRPEEVTASSINNKLPSSFKFCEFWGEIILFGITPNNNKLLIYFMLLKEYLLRAFFQ